MALEDHDLSFEDVIRLFPAAIQYVLGAHISGLLIPLHNLIDPVVAAAADVDAYDAVASHDEHDAYSPVAGYGVMDGNRDRSDVSDDEDDEGMRRLSNDEYRCWGILSGGHHFVVVAAVVQSLC